MTDAPNRFERLLARLAADPALASLARPGTAVLVWDESGSRLLWASPAAAGLRRALADETGAVSPLLRARHRLRALGGGLAPRTGTRLERLRLDPAGLSPPVTCACRLADLEGGETVLVTVAIGPIPKIYGLGASPAPSLSDPAQAGAEPSVGERPLPAPGRRSLIRFVWRCDPATRFLEVSPGLAEAVGPEASRIVGLTWDEVAGSVAEDPAGEVAALFARRETWSGRTVFWNIDGSGRQVPVDWAGMPVFGPGRELLGFRGFGLARMDAVRERAVPASPDEGANGPVPTDGGEGETARDPQPLPSTTRAEDAQAPDERLFERLRETVAATLAEIGTGENAPQTDPSPRDAASSPRPEAATGLSNAERNAFREIARALGARFDGEEPPRDHAKAPADEVRPDGDEAAPAPPTGAEGDRVLDRLPIGVLVHRGEEILFANRCLLDLTGFETGAALAKGGVAGLFGDSSILEGREGEGAPPAVTTRQGERIPVEVRQAEAEWAGAPAGLMTIRKAREPMSRDGETDRRLSLMEAELRQRESRVHELESILDTATDGVIVLDETGRIVSLNRSAEALFGYDQSEVAGDAITVLLSPESHIVALDYLESLRSPGVQSLLNDGREVQGRVRQGGTIPLFMTMGRVHDGPVRKFCAVLRDITAFKKAEGELVGAKRAAEEASAQKSDLLAKISHEIRTPLNAILGFAEVMLEERFGPVGNDRYKEYLKDIHASGAHVISLVNDLLDLAKVEAGRMELAFTSVSLNELVLACVALLQPQAARERIVMRTSFPAKLPPVVADERSMRQIVLNLVSNAIKFTDAGGQVIVSTALTDRGEVAFRVRDTGIGMTEKEIQAALEPFRQLATARRRGGTGLGLPLTKALVEANRGALQISSSPNEGTLVEVLFPPTRVLAG
ncbi:PAS domain S-box protein [Microvirga thermotolerans]|uniref:histidine kinase n=1 Tax=Microvirga thermotolerans TaxID=2651334 RepID=A0A5P9JVH7_9HYPH|nr:PAS domain S-box protein [Microvirga thermotolerans]QFU15656.1 PAS domain S-box protein [Microvirga thermotolerans]